MPWPRGTIRRGEEKARSIAIPAVSLVILTCLGLQIVVISRLLWAPVAFSHVYDVHWIRPTETWPFVDYPMYSEAHHEGERLATQRVVATADDGSPVIMRPEDRTIAPRSSALLIALIQKDWERAERYGSEYRRRNGRALNAPRLEDHLLELTRRGFVPRSPDPGARREGADPR